MFRKRKISELEKNEIIFDYLHEQLAILCANHDPHPETADQISRRIVHVNEQITRIGQKLQTLRYNTH